MEPICCRNVDNSFYFAWNLPPSTECQLGTHTPSQPVGLLAHRPAPSTVLHCWPRSWAPFEKLAVEQLRSKGIEEERLKEEEEVLLINSPHSSFPSRSRKACSSGGSVFFSADCEDRDGFAQEFDSESDRDTFGLNYYEMFRGHLWYPGQLAI